METFTFEGTLICNNFMGQFDITNSLQSRKMRIIMNKGLLMKLKHFVKTFKWLKTVTYSFDAVIDGTAYDNDTINVNYKIVSDIKYE